MTNAKHIKILDIKKRIFSNILLIEIINPENIVLKSIPRKIKVFTIKGNKYNIKVKKSLLCEKGDFLDLNIILNHSNKRDLEWEWI